MTSDLIGREHKLYFGRVFTDLQLDGKTLADIPEHLRTGEAALFATKNPGYRGLHPMAATMEFGGAYISAYRWTLRKREDFRLVGSRKIISAENPMEDTTENRLGFWKARRVADSLGAMYDHYCYLAMDYAERAGWAKLPLPRELAQSDVVAAVTAKLAV